MSLPATSCQCLVTWWAIEELMRSTVRKTEQISPTKLKRRTAIRRKQSGSWGRRGWTTTLFYCKVSAVITAVMPSLPSTSCDSFVCSHRDSIAIILISISQALLNAQNHYHPALNILKSQNYSTADLCLIRCHWSESWAWMRGWESRRNWRSWYGRNWVQVGQGIKSLSFSNWHWTSGVIAWLWYQVQQHTSLVSATITKLFMTITFIFVLLQSRNKQTNYSSKTKKPRWTWDTWVWTEQGQWAFSGSTEWWNCDL